MVTYEVVKVTGTNQYSAVLHNPHKQYKRVFRSEKEAAKFCEKIIKKLHEVLNKED